MVSGVRGAHGAAAAGTADAAPRRDTDSAKTGDRGAEGAGVTACSREAAIHGTAETEGGVHGALGAAAGMVTRRGCGDVTTLHQGQGARIAGAAAPKKEAVQVIIKSVLRNVKPLIGHFTY